jgi:hypothetical protein
MKKLSYFVEALVISEKVLKTFATGVNIITNFSLLMSVGQNKHVWLTIFMTGLLFVSNALASQA